jgi:small subunit ribosomal protein S1
MSVVVSRRQLLEERRASMKAQLLAQIEPGQLRKGVVRNIVDFGAFVDLGGIEGLLHISDLAWYRVHDPREVVRIDQSLEVVVLRVDRDAGKVALSLKHRAPNPWSSVAEKYPVGSRHKGEVVNVVAYGAFVRLEPGIEGLVHVSEMTWSRRHHRPFELVGIGDQVEVQVLSINKERQEISLGMKQVMPNPWDGVAGRYRPGEVKRGKVTRRTNFGLFVELEPGLEGLLHITELPDPEADRLADFKVDDEIDVEVLRIDAVARKIGLSRRDLMETGCDGR